VRAVMSVCEHVERAAGDLLQCGPAVEAGFESVQVSSAGVALSR
jgi:hypothetical protein